MGQAWHRLIGSCSNRLPSIYQPDCRRPADSPCVTLNLACTLQVQAQWGLSSPSQSMAPTDLGPWAWACHQGAGAWVGAWGAAGDAGTLEGIAGEVVGICKVRSVALLDGVWCWACRIGAGTFRIWRSAFEVHRSSRPAMVTTMPALYLALNF